MSDRVPKPPGASEITPPNVYFNRRAFIKAAAVAASVGVTATVYRHLNRLPPPTTEQPVLAGLQQPNFTAAAYPPQIAKAFRTDESQTPFQSITHYNNFYEFDSDKEGAAGSIGRFSTQGWKVVVDGLVSKPATFDMDDIRRISSLEERVYRMRCVEAWSMVIPWAGYPLGKLLDRVQPMSAAKFVAFTTLLDPTMMPGQRTDVLQWPYVEGLRMDEAMHPLSIVS